MELPGLSFKKQLDGFIDGVWSQLGGIAILLGAIWLVFLTDYIPYVQWSDWLALRPRHVTGLHGILTMPFAHGGFAHILSNTIPLIITLLTLTALRPKTWKWVVGLLIVTSGALTWLIAGYNSSIVGASGLVLALVTFLISPGLFLLAWWGYQRFWGHSKPYPFKIRLIPIAVSAVVGFFCMDNLFFNLVPVMAPMGGSNVSWPAHWSGAIAGCIVAFLFIRSGEGDALPDEVNEAITELKSKGTTMEDLEGDPKNPYKPSVS